jgi:RNA polymerase sigma factor (sigma-70 family)
MSITPAIARIDLAPAVGLGQTPASPKQFSPQALRDFALVQRILDQHDERAYAELMSYYQKAVYQIVFKMVHQSDAAEDLTLEIFIRAFHFLHTFKPVFAFSTWLFRVATNQSITYLQRNRLRTVSLDAVQFDGEASSFDLPDPTPTPQEAIIQLQRIERMHLAVDKLPAKYQEVVKMHYFEELSYEEIAERLHAPLGTVKGQLHRGRDLLQHMLEDTRDDI